MKDAMKPFENDAQVLTIGDLTVENGMEAITVTGEITLMRDKRGFAAAQALAETFQAVVESLKGEDLPEHAKQEEGDGGGIVDNPFRK